MTPASNPMNSITLSSTLSRMVLRSRDLPTVSAIS
jgi:hypothetical protein